MSIETAGTARRLELPCLGVNVYLWNQRLQDRFLAECLRPAAAELRSRVSGFRIWFDRYDIRGPHLFVLTFPSPSAREATRELLARSFDAFLHQTPAGSSVDLDAIEARHAGCRGRGLCPIDRQPGLAEEKTYVFFDQEAGRYPFHLTRYATDEVKLWRLLDELAVWTLDRLASGRPLASALAWLAAVDRVVTEVRGVSEPFWRYFASTLLLDLPERLETDEAAALEALPQSVGLGNRSRFEPIWSRQGSAPWSPLPRLVETTLAWSPPPDLSDWALLREVVHSALKQLSVHGAFEIPMILFAWSKSLPDPDSLRATP